MDVFLFLLLTWTDFRPQIFAFLGLFFVEILTIPFTAFSLLVAAALATRFVRTDVRVERRSLSLWPTRTLNFSYNLLLIAETVWSSITSGADFSPSLSLVILLFLLILLLFLRVFGVFALGSYGYTFQGFFTCYYLALPFFTNTVVSTFIFSILIETVYNVFNLEKKLNFHFKLNTNKNKYLSIILLFVFY